MAHIVSVDIGLFAMFPGKGVVELAKHDFIQAAVLCHPSFVTVDDIKGKNFLHIKKGRNRRTKNNCFKCGDIRGREKKNAVFQFSQEILKIF